MDKEVVGDKVLQHHFETISLCGTIQELHRKVILIQTTMFTMSEIQLRHRT